MLFVLIKSLWVMLSDCKGSGEAQGTFLNGRINSDSAFEYSLRGITFSREFN